MSDVDLRTLLETLNPKARDTLRRALIQDQPDRDEISTQLLRYRDAVGDELADIVDMPDDEPGGAAEGCATAS